MDQETLSLLEFPSVLSILERFAHSPEGRTAVSRIRPSTDRPAIEDGLETIAECTAYTAEVGRPGLRTLPDSRPLLANLAVQGQFLDPGELLEILEILKTGQGLRKALKRDRWPQLSRMLDPIPDLGVLVDRIERVLTPKGEVRDTADPQLANARKKQAEARKKVQQQLNSYLSGPKAKYLIDEPFLTLRNHRFVLPVRSENQKEFPGVVHATSSSGATLFIEPLPEIALNNQCIYYQEQEQEIIRRILRRLSDDLRLHQEVLVAAVRILARVDVSFAIAEFSNRYRCVAPRFAESNQLTLQNARHPLLLETLGDEEVVPISLQLTSDHRILVISGPNTGGKTLALKTIGLLAVMALSGLPVPAADAEIPILDQVLADIGDHQSISQKLSTFSAHILRLRNIIERVGASSLILLDELGTGTDPVHGSALSIAIVEFFSKRSSLVVATTHHSAVKQFASTTPGIVNASVLLDPADLKPTYELEFGLAGESSGLEIAGQLGLPLELVDRARQLLDPTELRTERYLEHLRAELARQREATEELRRQSTSLQRKEKELGQAFERNEQKRQNDLDRLLGEWANQFQQETGKFIRKLQDQTEARRLRREAQSKQARLREAFRQEMANQTRGPEPARTPLKLSKGDRVFHTFFRKPGVVVTLKNGEVVIDIEGKRISTSLDQLEGPPRQESRALPPNVTLDVVEEVRSELNLIGFRVEEALTKTDKFLDRAFLSQLSAVHIIHGFGTGKLKAALAEFLGEHPQVQKSRVEGGVTVVELI